MAMGTLDGNRESALTLETSEYTVDTCFTNDTDKWETGIQRLGTDWVIVEEYNDESEAETGHNKWVKFMAETPDELPLDINMGDS